MKLIWNIKRGCSVAVHQTTIDSEKMESQRWLVMILFIAAVLAFSLVPLSWTKSVTESSTSSNTRIRHRRNASTTDEDSVNVTEYNNDNVTMYTRCMQECYFNDQFPPQSSIASLLGGNFIPHPNLLLSVQLENIHRHIFCDNSNDDILCEEEQNTREIIEDLIAMNNSLKVTDSTNTLLEYRISYNETRYPRYLVQVHCNDMTDRIKVSINYLQLYNNVSGTNEWVERINDDVTISCNYC